MTAAVILTLLIAAALLLLHALGGATNAWRDRNPRLWRRACAVDVGLLVLAVALFVMALTSFAN